MLICDKCSGAIKEDSKFCPHCGDPVDENDKAPHEMVFDRSVVADIKIQFNYNSSEQYQKAVDICKNIPSYESIGENEQTQHTVVLPLTELDLIINLYDLVKVDPSSRIWINGQIAEGKDLTQSCIGCYKGRREASNKEQYCFGNPDFDLNFNIWGCKRLEMPFAQWAGWIDHGSFDEKGCWFFDKDKIKQELEKKVQENRLCPALDIENVFKTLEQFPDSVDPKEDLDWEYKSKREQNNGQWKNVAFGLKPISKKGKKYILKKEGMFAETRIANPEQKPASIEKSPAQTNTQFELTARSVENSEQKHEKRQEHGTTIKKPLFGFFVEKEGERTLQIENPMGTKLALWTSIALFPVIFSWLTLNANCKIFEKIAAFAWMGIFIFLFLK